MGRNATARSTCDQKLVCERLMSHRYTSAYAMMTSVSALPQSVSHALQRVRSRVVALAFDCMLCRRDCGHIVSPA